MKLYNSPYFSSAILKKHKYYNPKAEFNVTYKPSEDIL